MVPARLRPRNRAPGTAEVASPSQAAPTHSWLHSPTRVTSRTTFHTSSMPASTVTATLFSIWMRRGGFTASALVLMTCLLRSRARDEALHQLGGPGFELRGRPTGLVDEQEVDLRAADGPEAVA